MRMQGVIILRVSDFRRFFNLPEFWKKREEFLKLAKSELAGIFCDNEDEQVLFEALKNWCSGRVLRAELKSEELIVENGIMGSKHFFLGRLGAEVKSCRALLGPRNLIGLTVLYLLLGANRKDSKIPLEYSLLASLQTGNVVEDTVLLFSDRTFESTDTFVAPLRRCVIANMHEGQVSVKAGQRIVILNAGECVVGLFCGNACYRLLPNVAMDDVSSRWVRLWMNPKTYRPSLKISNQESIEGISSFWVEPGVGVAYTTFDGKVHFDENSCYLLKTRLDSFYRSRPNDKLLAIEVDEGRNYVLYSEAHVSY